MTVFSTRESLGEIADDTHTGTQESFGAIRVLVYILKKLEDVLHVRLEQLGCALLA